jgi:dTDP-4-dehydrorhamnose reductase
MGERFVVENIRQHLVCRAGWMMGGGPGKDKKFIHKLMRQLKEGTRELFIVDDKLGTPTYTMDFARNVELLLATRLWGIYNMVCQGVTSRLEVARHLVAALGIDGAVRITPVSSDYFSEEYFAPRPQSEQLLTKKLDLRGLNIMRDWRLCLDEYLAEAYQGYLTSGMSSSRPAGR